MRTNDTFKVWRFHCATCHVDRDVLQWNYDPAPLCCEQPMAQYFTRADTLQIITDDIPGGYTAHNGFKTPTTFYSKRAHREALAANGCRLAERGEAGF